jgi:hypothetical protein
MTRNPLFSDPSQRIAIAFARQSAKLRSAGLCSASREVLSVTGVGIALFTPDHPEHVCASSPAVEALEDLQFTTGTGPSRDAFDCGEIVEMPNLDDAAGSRWPSFVEMAEAKSIAAVFCFPLIVHGANVGVLSVYQRAEGSLTLSQRQDAIALVGIQAQTILSMQQPATSIGDEGLASAAVGYRAELYQASGMLAVQLRIPAAEALLRIRAHAFAHGQAVGAVAAEIVARRLRLPDDRPDDEGRN